MTRVLHIGHIVGLAGAERALLHTLAVLRDSGIDASMLMLYKPHKYPTEFVELLEAADIPMVPVPVPHTDSLINPYMLGIVRRTAAAIREVQPDIVQTHQIYSNFYGTLAARLAGVRRVIATRANTGAFYRQRHWQAVNWALWKLRAAGVAISGGVRDYVVRYEHVSPEKVYMIHNAVESPADLAGRAEQRAALRASLNISPNAPVVGSVARLVEVKGLRYGLDAFARARQRVPDAHYIIAGDGPLRDDLTQQAQRLGVADAVHFLGWRSDTAAIYDAMDVLMLPSLAEGFGLVLAEAMARCVPVVATAVGGIPEVVADGETGLLVSPADADALVEPLVRLLTGEELARQFGAAGRQRVESKFSFSRQAADYQQLYADVMAR